MLSIELSSPGVVEDAQDCAERAKASYATWGCWEVMTKLLGIPPSREALEAAGTMMLTDPYMTQNSYDAPLSTVAAVRHHASASSNLAVALFTQAVLLYMSDTSLPVEYVENAIDGLVENMSLQVDETLRAHAIIVLTQFADSGAPGSTTAQAALVKVAPLTAAPKSPVSPPPPPGPKVSVPTPRTTSASAPPTRRPIGPAILAVAAIAVFGTIGVIAWKTAHVSPRRAVRARA